MRRSARRGLAVLGLILGLGLVAGTVGPAASSFADSIRATDVTATFVQWHDGQDQFQLTWTPPTGTVGHYAVFGASGPNPPTPPSAPLATVDGDQSSAIVNVPVVWSFFTGYEVSFSVYAYDDATNSSASSDPIVVPADVGTALVGKAESGVLHQVRLSWSAPAAGDDVELFQVTGGGEPFDTGTPVTVTDATAAGSVLVDLGSGTLSSQYALYETVTADPDQRSPATYASAASAPNPLTHLTIGPTADYTGIQANWQNPTGCLGVSVLHCINARVVVKEGTVAPTSPSDGFAFYPALDQPGFEGYGGGVSGIQLGHTYTVSVFNVPWLSLDTYSPRASATMVYRGAPFLSFPGARATKTVTYGTKVTLHVKAVLPTTPSQPIAGLPTTLGGTGGKFSGNPVASGVTGSDGTVALTFEPTRSSPYQADTASTPLYDGSFSGDQPAIDVRPLLSLSLNHSSVRHGAKATFSGTLKPHRTSVLRLQRHTSSGWHTVATTHSSASGAYTFAIHPSSRGTSSYRVERSGDYLLVTGTSRTVHLKVT